MNQAHERVEVEVNFRRFFQAVEKFLHHHKDIEPSRVRDLPGHENELELFIIGKNLTLQKLTNIIKENINNYKDLDIEIQRLQLENEKLKIQNSKLKNMTTVIMYKEGIQYVSIFNAETRELELIKFNGQMICLN